MESVIKKLGKTSVTVEKDYHSSKKEYNKLTVVEEEGAFKTYLSRKPVPIGIELTNREYWIPFSGVLESIVFDYIKFKQEYGSGEKLEDNAIKTRHIENSSITSSKIQDNSIVNSKIEDNTIEIEKLSTNLRDAIKVATGAPEDLNELFKKVGNYPEQFVLDLGILNSQSEGENIAAASEVAGNRNISFIRFKVQDVSELKTTLIMQWPNGINETAQFMCVDKAQWRRNVTGATGVKGDPTNAFQWERTAPHSISYDKSRRMIQLKDYQQIVSREVELPLASSSQHGLMSTDDKKKLNKMEPVAEVTWTAQHTMNAYTEFGEYHIHGERTNANDGLPILNANPGHTIDAMLTVLDSSLTNGTGKNTDVCVTQILRMSNRTGGDGHIWIRTGQGSDKSNLTWFTWEKLQGIFEKNTITDISEINTFTTNGIYSCMYVGSDYVILDSSIKVNPGATLLIIVINGYMASSIGLNPQLTQSIILTQPNSDANYIFTRHATFSNNSWMFNNRSNIVLGSAYITDVNIGTMSSVNKARINIGIYADGKVNINNAFIGKDQEIIGTNVDSVVIHKGAILGTNTKLRENIRIEPNTEIGSHNIIGDNIRIGTNVSIGTEGNSDNIVHISPNVRIYDAVRIGKNINIANYTTIKNNVSIGETVNIGDNVNIGPSVDIGNNTIIGDQITIGANTTIEENAYIRKECIKVGSIFIGTKRDPEYICHIGQGVSINDNVNIGNDVVIEQATNIGEGVNIGNLVNIGQDVVIEQGAYVGGNVNISGNVSIGSCIIGTNSINFYDNDIPTGFIQFDTDEGLVIFQSKGKSYTLQLS